MRWKNANQTPKSTFSDSADQNAVGINGLARPVQGGERDEMSFRSDPWATEKWIRPFEE
jgi:hypothetical protein